ncbi:NRAMP family divalent metal transporter [Novosphingopyxis sp. YJ-S2-01]|uniref:NRAMP family divalent metal transporter n=1 Tax=Novosphingopyxis sp. YJ-S2-01 TaxID=2794021 RepID=UPI0018DB99F1|nr:divalent metal cation transporter [Novosphingopyxis sp. YJ-S2-01]MBH9538689.1 divalent metal cation transporter [Novosphingopyxis sp. YJ-S2-01]
MARYKPGPGMLVAAAFIGPGTVTACSVAGVDFGMTLLWALVFAGIATITLQYAAARVAVLRGQGLARAMVDSAGSAPTKLALGLLIVVALGLGNAAYESGNIGGAALGLGAIGWNAPAPWPALCIGAVAAGLLAFGQVKWLMRLLVALVMLMSLAFLTACIAVRPDPGALLAGLVPRIPEGGLFTAIALIGTTIVPYNLFLHAAASRERWSADENPAEMRLETIVSIGLGALVSIAILITAAASGVGGGIGNAADIARQVEPVYGPLARYAIGAGLFGAGLTSSVTAPMATGYILSELWPGGDPKRLVFRITATLIVLIGTLVAATGADLVAIILVAQVANGLLLPIVAGILVWLIHRSRSTGAPLLWGAGLVWLICLLLGTRLVLRALGLWP